MVLFHGVLTMNIKTADGKYKIRSGIYSPCKKCGQLQASKHEHCMDCRRKQCAHCGNLVTKIVGKTCSVCMRKRGRE